MKIIVTGSAGFIGSNLCEELLRQNEEVIGIDNFDDYYSPAQKEKNLVECLKNSNFTLYRNSVTDREVIAQIVAQHKPKVIVHLGGLASVRFSIGKAKLYNEVNVLGSINLLDAAIENNVQNFIYAGTSSIYGNTQTIPFIESDPCNSPLAPYAASRKAVETLGYSYHNLYQLNFTVLRFFSVYGPRGRPDMMPYIAIDKISNNEKIVLFDSGQMWRDWTYINDVINGVIAAIKTPLGYEIINLGRGKPILMADFIKILEELIGKKAFLECSPAPASEIKINYANIDKAKRLLGYIPSTDLRSGLEKMWEWYQCSIKNEC
ncbi:MAG: NAD-dependent epimerase/dehydratase family protein [Deltaproteobacteria bacterium]|jgi:UDP-glucuronate 4-epimerase|nr:NAD-dependent epimerase/dehydratase family protein [Deltaproteobacteria bacterium]